MNNAQFSQWSDNSGRKPLNTEPCYSVGAVACAIGSLGYPDGPDIYPEVEKIRGLVDNGEFVQWLKGFITVSPDYESPSYQPDSMSSSESASADAEDEWRATRTLETLTETQRRSLLAQVDAGLPAEIHLEISQLMPLGSDEDDQDERDNEYLEETNEEKEIDKEHLPRIVPSNEWQDVRASPDPPMPDPELLIKSMHHVSLLASQSNYMIGLVVCGFDSSLYINLDVDEENFYTGDGFSMSDYVPISPADLVDLIKLDPRSKLDQIQSISKGRHCIVTTRGKAAWAEGVFYPHT